MRDKNLRNALFKLFGDSVVRDREALEAEITRSSEKIVDFLSKIEMLADRMDINNNEVFVAFSSSLFANFLDKDVDPHEFTQLMLEMYTSYYAQKKPNV